MENNAQKPASPLERLRSLRDDWSEKPPKTKVNSVTEPLSKFRRGWIGSVSGYLQMGIRRGEISDPTLVGDIDSFVAHYTSSDYTDTSVGDILRTNILINRALGETPPITWSRALFPEDSIGHSVFPEVLEGRKRSSAFLSRPANRFIFAVKRWSLLKEARVSSVGDLMVTDQVTVTSWLQKPEQNLAGVKERLQQDLLKTAMGPEDRLLAAIFGERNPQNVLIDPALEASRRKAIENTLDSLSYHQRRVIEDRFGLASEEPKSLDELMGKYGKTREWVRQVEAKSLRILRHPSRSGVLRDFLPSPEEVLQEIPQAFQDFLRQELAFK